MGRRLVRGVRGIGALLAMLGAIAAPASAPAGASCHISAASISVTIDNLRPLVNGEINGSPVRFLADTGAAFSLLPNATAVAFHLPISPAPMDLRMTGLGGSFRPSVARVQNLQIEGVALHNVEFLVGGTDADFNDVGILGQNFWHIDDLELDFGHGALRFDKTSGCGRRILAYWARPGDAVIVLDLIGSSRSTSSAIVPVLINGVRMRAELDTGASTSVLTFAAARRAGIDPNGPDVTSRGVGLGVGHRGVTSRVARVNLVDIGGERVEHTRLGLVDDLLPDVDMLLGEDFFLSHRVYIARDQGKVYATYEGGPVFNLGGSSVATTARPEAASETRASTGKVADALGSDNSQSLGLKAAAELSRLEFEAAIADFSRALALEPRDADFLLGRGEAYARSRRPGAALADLDAALSLTPDDIEARLTRAGLRIGLGELTKARDDLDSAAALMPEAANTRLELAELYNQADAPRRAMASELSWARAHADDARSPIAQGVYCRASAVSGTQLLLGLKACDHAVKASPKAPGTLTWRGVIRLRLGDAERAAADLSDAADLAPKSAIARYCLGLADQRLNLPRAGQDLAAGLALDPGLADWAKRHGLTS